MPDDLRRIEALPWRMWVGFLAGMGIIGGVCFSKAESKATASPGVWFAAGFIAVVLLVLVGAFVTLPGRRWKAAAVFAAVAAGVVALAFVSAASPSTTRSCNSNGQPTGSGTFDCDNGYALGLPFEAAALFIPALGLSAIGKRVSELRKR